MPTLKPTEQDDQFAKRVNERMPEGVPHISKATAARWRAGRWPKRRPHEAGFLTRKRRGFGGPVLYTQEAERTARCVATVMQEMRNDHLRPRLNEAVLVCFFRGHEFKFEGLCWAYRAAIDRLRDELERPTGPGDEQAMARAVGRELSRRSGAQGTRMRRRLKAGGAPSLQLVMVGVIRAFLDAGRVRPEHLLAFGWPGPVQTEDQVLAEKISLDGMTRLFDPKSDECVSLDELLRARADLPKILTAGSRIAGLVHEWFPSLPADVDMELPSDQSELTKAMTIPGIVVLRRQAAGSSNRLDFDTIMDALGSDSVTDDSTEEPPKAQ